jgi:hypothetical protein
MSEQLTASIIAHFLTVCCPLSCEDKEKQKLAWSKCPCGPAPRTLKIVLPTAPKMCLSSDRRQRASAVVAPDLLEVNHLLEVAAPHALRLAPVALPMVTQVAKAATKSTREAASPTPRWMISHSIPTARRTRSVTPSCGRFWNSTLGLRFQRR